MSIADFFKRTYLRSGFYRKRLAKAPPVVILHRPSPFWSGDADLANGMFQGRYVFSGREAKAPNQPPWRLRADDEGWMQALHGFDWLQDFAAMNIASAGEFARRLVRSWIDLCPPEEGVIWSARTTADRMFNWLAWTAILLPEEGADPRYIEALERSLGRQDFHLQKIESVAPRGFDRLRIALARAALVMVCDFPDRTRQERLDRLLAVLDRQLLADGGHISRNPAVQHRLLRDLLLLADISGSAGQADGAGEIRKRAQHMSNLLVSLRHGDGCLADFNGAYEQSAAEIDNTLSILREPAKAVLSAPQSRFHRLLQEDCLVLVDAGCPMREEQSLDAYASASSFEFSVGPDRLVVNCGSGVGRRPDWQLAARRGLAHSLLTIAEEGPVALDAAGRLQQQPGQINARRHEDEENNIWIELGHDGFARKWGLNHQRRFFLDGRGGDFRGEDQLVPPPGDKKAKKRIGQTFRAAFHLHPDVSASRLQNGAILLRLKSGSGWRFIADGGDIRLEESVYLGQAGKARRSQQIVITGPVGQKETIIRWAFRRL